MARRKLMPKISVIMPVYNIGNYIKRAVESLLHQSLYDIEILCINDGSTDNSLSILQDYASRDKRVRVFTQPNAGVGTARNLGLSKATGTYIMFCDSDDWYEPLMCQRLYQTMTQENVDLVCCDCFVDYETDLLGRNKSNLSWHSLRFKGKWTLSEKIKKKINTVLWNKIFKRDLIDRYHITFPNIREHDDDAFVFQYLYAATAVYGLPEKLYHYCLRKNSIMSTFLLTPQKANKWDILLAWRHVSLFLVNQLHYSCLPAVQLEQFGGAFQKMREHFHWEHISPEDINQLRGILQDLPLDGKMPIQQVLLQLREDGDIHPLLACCAEYKKRWLGIITYEHNFKESRLFILGIEIYKKNFIENSIRVLGLFRFKTQVSDIQSL